MPGSPPGVPVLPERGAGTGGGHGHGSAQGLHRLRTQHRDAEAQPGHQPGPHRGTFRPEVLLGPAQL